LNHENVIGSFDFTPPAPTTNVVQPTWAVATVPHLQTGLPEHWLGLQLASKYDGDGFREQPRPALSLALVLDISGSMSQALEVDEAMPYYCAPGKSKLDAAKRCLLAIIAQCDAADCVSVVLFNHEQHTLQAPTAATAAAKAAIAHKIEGVRSGGGTRLEAGFRAGLTELAGAAGEQPLRRVYFLTDMQSHVQDEEAVLAAAEQAVSPTAPSRRGRAAKGSACVPARPIHTTVIGMGVDLSVGTVEKISSLPGGKYGSVATASEFERSIGAEFSHDVTPIAFDLDVRLTNGWAIERACGSAELNGLSAGATCARISSEFSSPNDANGMVRGGVICFKLRAPPPCATPAVLPAVLPARRTTRHSQAPTEATEGADSALPALGLHATWKTLEGNDGMHSTSLHVPPLAPSGAIASAALRKVLALVRFVELQKAFCELGGSDDSDLDGRLVRLASYKAGRDDLLAEMRALGDASLLDGGANHAFLQTLLQIIELEASETEAQIREKERAAAAAAAVAAAAASSAAGTSTAAAAGSASGKRRSPRGKRKRGSDGGASAAPPPPAELPNELVCPILRKLMSDPVSTTDGHTYERDAIRQWLAAHDTSPLTGLRLASKALTPNHSLRSLARAFAGR